MQRSGWCCLLRVPDGYTTCTVTTFTFPDITGYVDLLRLRLIPVTVTLHVVAVTALEPLLPVVTFTVAYNTSTVPDLDYADGGWFYGYG